MEVEINYGLSLAKQSSGNDFIKNIINTVFVRAGETRTSYELAILRLDIEYIIMKDYRHLTLNDIREAFEKGLFGEYGKYYGLNVRTLESWLNSYDVNRIENNPNGIPITDESRMIEQKSTMTTTEIDEIMEESFERKYSEYCANGKVEDMGNALYNWLDSKGEIPFTNDEKREIKETARRELIAEKKREKDFMLLQNTIPLQAVIASLEKQAYDTEGMVVSRAKKIALNMYFKQIKNNE